MPSDPKGKQKRKPVKKPFLSRKGKPRSYKQKRCDMVFNGSYIPKHATIHVVDTQGKGHDIVVDTVASGIRKPTPRKNSGCLLFFISLPAFWYFVF